MLLIEPRVFTDARGYFTEIYNEDAWSSLGLPTTWVQDNRSRSLRNVIRGLHFQTGTPQGKLVSVIHGVVFDVALDVRRGSPTFGKSFSTVLNSESVQALYIPPGFAHGLCTMSDEAFVSYKCDAIYQATGDRGIRWNDSALGIPWPIADPILSEKDAALPTLADMLRDDPGALPQYAG